MARTNATRDAALHPMPYCGIHARAWYPGPTNAGWIPYPPALLTAVHMCLAEYGCSDVLLIVYTKCDVCKEHAHAA